MCPACMRAQMTHCPIADCPYTPLPAMPQAAVVASKGDWILQAEPRD